MAASSASRSVRRPRISAVCEWPVGCGDADRSTPCKSARRASSVRPRPARGQKGCTVTGFGCRPARTAPHAPRAGVRKPPGNEVAGRGALGSTGAMGIWGAPFVLRVRVAGRAVGRADCQRATAAPIGPIEHGFGAGRGVGMSLDDRRYLDRPCAIRAAG
jgi:hypothetical protein